MEIDNSPIAPSLDVFAGTQQVRHESLPCVQGPAYVPFAPLGVSTDGLLCLVCDVMNNQPSPPAQTQLAYESLNEGSSWSTGSPPPQPPQGVTAAGAGLALGVVSRCPDVLCTVPSWPAVSGCGAGAHAVRGSGRRPRSRPAGRPD
jgi:hypothetical protein